MHACHSHALWVPQPSRHMRYVCTGIEAKRDQLCACVIVCVCVCVLPPPESAVSSFLLTGCPAPGRSAPIGIFRLAYREQSRGTSTQETNSMPPLATCPPKEGTHLYEPSSHPLRETLIKLTPPIHPGRDASYLHWPHPSTQGETCPN